MYSSGAEQQGRNEVQALADKLYRERYPHLLSIATKNAANSEDAAEAVQFAFLAFLGHYDPEGGAPPLAWLTLTAKRRCWALHRAQHLNRRVGQEAAPDSAGSGFSIANLPAKTGGVEEAVERAEYVLEARERLSALKPHELRALTLLAAGYSYQEIAAMNRWTYTKVNRCIAEGRARLRANAATEQPQAHRPGGETERAYALASRPAKKEEAVDSSDLNRPLASEVVR